MSVFPVYEKAVFFARWRPLVTDDPIGDITPIEEEIVTLRQLERLWIAHSAEYRVDYIGDFVADGIDPRSDDHKEMLDLAGLDTLTEEENERMCQLLLAGMSQLSLWSPLAQKRICGSLMLDGVDVLEFIPNPATLKVSDAHWWGQYTDSTEDVIRANDVMRTLAEAGLAWRESQQGKSIRGNEARTAAAFHRQYAFLHHYIDVYAEDTRRIHTQSAYIDEANRRCANEGFDPLSESGARKVLEKLATTSSNNSAI